MLWKKTRTRVAGSLIAGIALLVGVSQVMAEPKQLELSKQKQLTVSGQKQIGVSEPRIQGVSEPLIQKVFKTRPIQSGHFSKGKYTPAQRTNPFYTRCAKREGFDERRKCALEGARGDLSKEDN